MLVMLSANDASFCLFLVVLKLLIFSVFTLMT